MDNASFHWMAQIEQLCHEAGVKLVYLPPYSPDLNPIEEFFAELKGFIKKHWQAFESCPEQDFDMFLEWCLNMVGAKKGSAQGHFRHAGDCPVKLTYALRLRYREGGRRNRT